MLPDEDGNFMDIFNTMYSFLLVGQILTVIYGVWKTVTLDVFLVDWEELS